MDDLLSSDIHDHLHIALSRLAVDQRAQELTGRQSSLPHRAAVLDVVDGLFAGRRSPTPRSEVSLKMATHYREGPSSMTPVPVTGADQQTEVGEKVGGARE